MSRAVPPRRAAAVAGRVDLALSVGPGTALAHRRIAVRLAREAGRARHELYEGIWGDAAAELGAVVHRLADGTLELRRDGRVARVRGSETELDDADAVILAGDRARAQAAMRRAGVPCPEAVSYRLPRLGPARALLGAGGGSVVVKPAGGTGAGHGITCAVRTRGDLLRASLAAARFDAELVAERQAPGSMYRLLVLDGEVIGTVRRDPPHVVGDGRSTIAELVLAENRRRLAARGAAGLHLVRPDLDCLLTLRAAGLRLRSVLAAGVRVPVKTATSEGSPADNATVREPLAAELTGVARAAAVAVGLRLAGVDVVTPSLDRDPREVGGVVLEVNAFPGLHHHYQVADPRNADRVAVPILERLLAPAQAAGS